MPSSLRPLRPSARPSGSSLILVLAIVLVLAVAGVAIVRVAGGDRVDAAKLGVKDRGLACAEAGLQYARRFFGSRYETSNGWNDYLADGSGYRFDPSNTTDQYPPDFSALPWQVRGSSAGTSTLDPGADLDGDGQPDFWVSIRDDDDERPLGIANDSRHDNNETVIIRSECTNSKFAVTEGGQPVNVVLESVLTHVQGSSGYGTSAKGSNATDLVGGR
jgi:hypothetical protein